MKKTSKILIGIGTVVIIAAITMLSSNSELFKGFIKLERVQTVTIKDKPLMLVLFSENKGYPIQISGDGLGVEASIRVDHCGTTEEGEKWCEFEYSDKNNNDSMISLVKDRDTHTLYDNSGYKYNIKVVDVIDYPKGSTQSERTVIELNKVKQ